MCVFDGGADPYFCLHSAVVCDVEVGCFVHEPTGCLAVAGLASEPAEGAVFLALTGVSVFAVCVAAVVPNCSGCATSYKISLSNAAPAQTCR